MVRLWIRISLLSSLIACAMAELSDDDIVRTKTGSIRGKLVQAPNMQPVYEFTGIPFAEPPVGNLRFRKTVPKKPWTGVLDATKPTNACQQFMAGNAFAEYTSYYLVDGTQVSEDCLYLNIWVPKAAFDQRSSATAKKLAVFHFIYGGGFVTGASMLKLYNGTVLAANGNIIVATLQYRLGALGFLNLGTEEAPGNQGLWDQLEAMKWIYENIGAFGGNSNEITLGGESSGSVSVTCHMLSSYSRKYFHRAILESGSALSSWGMHSADSSKAVTNALLTMVAAASCNTTTPAVTNSSSVQEKIKCLRSAPAEEFSKADLNIFYLGHGFGWAPIVDGDFVPRDPKKMLHSGDFYKVPTLGGVDRDEGSWFFYMSPEAMEILPSGTVLNRSVDGLNITHYNRLIEIGVSLLSGYPRPNIAQTDPLHFKAIQLHYWPRGASQWPIGSDVVSAMLLAASDYTLACPTFDWLQATSSYSALSPSVFVYYFTHRTSTYSGVVPDWMGVLHGDEMFYIFGEPLAPYAESFGYLPDEQNLSKAVIQYIANFVSFGDPNGEKQANSSSYVPTSENTLRQWPPYVTPDCPQKYFDISVDTLVKQKGDGTICYLKVKDCMFWNELFSNLAEPSLNRCSG